MSPPQNWFQELERKVDYVLRYLIFGVCRILFSYEGSCCGAGVRPGPGGGGGGGFLYSKAVLVRFVSFRA